MGMKNVKPLNSECPISLEKIERNNSSILSCGHQYNNYYLQLYCSKYLSEGKNLSCPLCRKDITKKEYKKIFSNYKLLKQSCSVLNQLNVLSISEAYHCQISLKKIKCKGNNGNRIEIYLPLYYVNNIKQPLILQTNVNKLKISPHPNIILLSDNYTTEYNENVYKYTTCIKMFSKEHIWHFLLNKLIKKLINNLQISVLDTTSIDYDIKISLRIIRLLINDKNNIKTYDIINGNIYEEFVIKSYSALINFMPYFMRINNSIILINKLFSLMYY